MSTRSGHTAAPGHVVFDTDTTAAERAATTDLR